MRVPPPRPRLPDPPPAPKDGKGIPDVEPVVRHLRSLRESLNRELGARSVDTAARGNLLLISPGGFVYEIVVDDAGVLSTNQLAS